MSVSGIGGNFFSISHSGMMLFQQGSVNSAIGGTQIDLVSAPIAPGEYRLEINTAAGGVEIFLPHYVQFSIEGGSVLGGRDVHESPDMWHKMQKKLHKKINLPEQPPDFATASPDPERPVMVHFIVKSVVGGLDIYRL